MAESMPRADLLAALRERAENNPDKAATTYVSDLTNSSVFVERSFSELDSEARRIASWLQERFNPGDRALLLYSSGLEFAAAFFGCLYAGLIAVPCSKPGRYSHERRRLAGIARDASVRVVLTESASSRLVEKWAADEGVPDVVCHGTDSADAGDPGAWTMPSITPETLALLQYTSGSTGQPKGVMVSHRNLLTNVDSVANAAGVDRSARYGGWVPLYHDMGLIGLMLGGVLRGTGYVQLDPMTFLRRPDNWLRMLDRFDVQFTASPDFGYDLCVRRVTDEQLADLDLSRLLTASNGAEPVRASTVTRFRERFAAAGLRPDVLVPMYGLAEATLLVSGTPRRVSRVVTVDVSALEQKEFRQADTGRALVGSGRPTGADVLIVDPDTREVQPENRIGEIWLSGPSVTTGYWAKEDVTEAIFGARTADGRGPFLRTGDLGCLHDGDLFVTGRLKDTLIVHGRNLYPQDIEHELRAQHEELEGLQGVVFTVGGSDGEVIVAVHEIRGHWGEERLREIAAAMKQTMAKEFGVPVGAVVLVRPGGVRRTTSGKVERSAMRESYLDGALVSLLLSEDPMLTAVLAERRGVTG